MVASIEELILARDCLIFRLQNLVFLINIKKIDTPTTPKSGMEINLLEMVIALSQEKKDQILHQRRSLLKKPTVSIRELTKLNGLLTSTAITALPAPL